MSKKTEVIKKQKDVIISKDDVLNLLILLLKIEIKNWNIKEKYLTASCLVSRVERMASLTRL